MMEVVDAPESNRLVLSPLQVACHSAELHFSHVLGKHCCAAVQADKFKGWPGSDLNSFLFTV